MAHVHADNTGRILRFTTFGQEASPAFSPANPPSGAVFVQLFDDLGNPGLISALQSTNYGGYTMPGGTLTVGGVPATINPPLSNITLDPALVSSALAKIFVFPQVNHLSTEEIEALFRDLLRRAGAAPANQ